jgi:hypothetical protein
MPQDFEKSALQLGAQIHTHTIQLLKADDKYGYLPDATGVLLNVGPHNLLLTAAHVTKVFDAGKELYVNTKRGIVRLAGLLRDTDLVKDKKTDLAYFILPEELSNHISQTHTFLPIYKVANGHIPLPTQQYLIVGYPTANFKVEGSSIITGTTIYLTSMANEEIYTNAQFDQKRHYILNYDENGTDLKTGGSIKTVLHPHGISGCGIWLIDGSSNEGKIEYTYHLIGIIKAGTGYHIMGTRIELLIDALVKLEGMQIA